MIPKPTTKNSAALLERAAPRSNAKAKKSSKNAFTASANRKHNRREGITYSRRKGSKIELDTGAEGSD